MACQFRMVDLPPEQKITSEQLKQKLLNEKVYVVDVRSKDEIKDAIIKADKNVNIPISDVENSLRLNPEEFKAKFGIEKPPADGANVVFHCGKGARGSMATEIAVKLGFLKAQNLEGGYKKYVES